MLKYQRIASSFGALTLVWQEDEDVPRVVRVLLPRLAPSESDVQRVYPEAQPDHQRDIDALAGLIGRFLAGGATAVPVDLLDRTMCTPFQWRVLMADYAIPRGQVKTYQQIAVEVGRPNGARAVGGALAHNPFPVIIPCHRVVRADGSLGGYAGGVEMKRSLLQMEGWQFDGQGRLGGPVRQKG